MKMYIVVFSLLAFAFTAQPASAGNFTAKNKDMGVGCPYADVDLCFHSGDWWVTNWTYPTGPITTCSISGGCWSCLANVFGKSTCQYGTGSGGCNCTNLQRAGSGPGITDCVPTGSCTFRSTP
jgi:hypothetical protein